MKMKILSLSLACLLAQPALAAVSPKPKACPSVAAIKSIGVVEAEKGQYGWTAWNLKNHYNTSEEWSFVMIGLELADNQADALTKYNTAISTLSLVEGPSQNDSGEDQWGCLYADNESEVSILGIAITPALEIPTQAIRFKR